MRHDDAHPSRACPRYVPARSQSDETSSASIIAKAGKISILDTAITSYDASTGKPDERLAGRAYIAALSQQESTGEISTSRMDVEDSEISYLGNEGDYHNDISESSRLCGTRTELRVWKGVFVAGRDESQLSMLSLPSTY